MNERIKLVSKFCPREFARKPETLEFLKDYKATQHRQFLLYFGIVVTRGILKVNIYLHYVLLHAAIRCLSMKSSSGFLLEFADKAIKKFISTGINIYDLNFFTLTIHSLLHIKEDVKKFGPLDTYSAFPYENNMIFFRKFYKKPGMPLKQIHNRFVERERKKINTVIMKRRKHKLRLFNKYRGKIFLTSINKKDKRYCKMFKNAQLKDFCLGISLNDNCCILKDEQEICLIKNIYRLFDQVFLLIQKFQKKKFFTISVLNPVL